MEKRKNYDGKEIESFVLSLSGFSSLANFPIKKYYSSIKFSTVIHNAFHIL